MTDLTLTGPHWDFALAVYTQDGVSAACVALQDEFGIDVNVLLLALWAGLSNGCAVDAGRIALLDAVATDLREAVVVPLREVRRAMKPMALGAHGDSVRNRVKAAELAAEQLEQAVLAREIADWPQGPSPSPREIVALVCAHYAPYRPINNGVATTIADAAARSLA